MSRPSSRLNFWSVPPSSTSASHGDRVVALQQRVEQLEHRDRLAAPPSAWRSRRARAAARRWSCARSPSRSAIGMSSHSLLRRTSRRSGSASRIRSACSWKVAAFASISSLGEHRAQRRAPGRVAHARRVVADDQHDPVAGVLELAQLAQHDRVAEVDVRRRRVDAELHAQRPPLARRPARASPRAPPRAGSRRRCAARRWRAGASSAAASVAFGMPGQC